MQWRIDLVWTWGGPSRTCWLINETTGDFWRHKTPSTPHDSSEGVMNGVNAICGNAGVKPSDVSVFLHGTTVATNAVLEGKGAKVGLITTEGYRQVMQIARSLVPGGWRPGSCGPSLNLSPSSRTPSRSRGG